MKKFLSLLILPLVAFMCLVGCGGDKTPKDIQDLYNSMRTAFVVEEENVFFADSENPDTITIAYNETIRNQINNAAPTTDLQKRYVALGVQQDILNNIFNFYENNQEEFYRELSSVEYKNAHINELYDSLEALKDTLKGFQEQYSQFMTDVESGDIMVFSVLSYTYQLNKVIDSSFNFIYTFMDVYNTYCVEKSDTVTAAALTLEIEKSYVDIANVVYLQNIRTFNYSVGEKGVCDLLPLIDNTTNEYNLVSLMSEAKVLATTISENMGTSSDTYTETMNKINDFMYYRELLAQRITTFRNLMDTVDDYTLNEYRFDLVNGVEYDTYINSLSASDKASVQALDAFVNDIFTPFVAKLNLIVA
ncbi:MAG: hypothetical protein E7354_02070 [Clostridiales bacterium]|nr:hypothetical protein [Clostridiales bacterium]